MSQDNVWEWLLEQSVFQLLLKSRQWVSVSKGNVLVWDAGGQLILLVRNLGATASASVLHQALPIWWLHCHLGSLVISLVLIPLPLHSHTLGVLRRYETILCLAYGQYQMILATMVLCTIWESAHFTKHAVQLGLVKIRVRLGLLLGLGLQLRLGSGLDQKFADCAGMISKLHLDIFCK